MIVYSGSVASSHASLKERIQDMFMKVIAHMHGSTLLHVQCTLCSIARLGKAS